MKSSYSKITAAIRSLKEVSSMEQYIKGFKGFTPVKVCGLSPLASFYIAIHDIIWLHMALHGYFDTFLDTL